MENRDDKDIFNYTYCADIQQEIKDIRSKYISDDNEDRLARLRRLDAGVTQKATMVALMVGIIGALIMGFGMSLIMSDLSKLLMLNHISAVIIGISAGIAGMAVLCCAYPLYNRILKKEKEKVAPEIIRLTDELMK